MRVKLKDVCTFYTGTGFPKKYQGQLSGTYPFYKVGDIANNVVSGKVYLEQCNNYISEETLELIKGSIIPKNTIVFAKIGEALKLNRRAITSTDCLIDNNAMGIAAKSDKLRTLFFYYFMRNIKMELLAESTTVPSVRKSRLEAYEIDIPSLDEQKIIEGKLTILSKVINLKEKQLLKLDELVKARFVEMFGDLKVNDKGWKYYKLDELTELITDGEHATPKRTTQGIYLLSARNVLNHQLSLEDVDYIDYDEFSRISRRIIPREGDVLISCSGSIGRCCVVPKNIKFQMVRSIALLRFKSNINPVFAEYMITSDYLQDQINKSKTASSQANLFQGKIKSLKGVVPPLELQNQFASFVEEIDKSRSRIQKSLEASQELFDSLMQEYFG